MENDISELKKEYEAQKPLFVELDKEARFIIEGELDKRKIKYHSLPTRIKNWQSVEEKLQRYSQTDLSQINDFVGLRIICLFLSQIKDIRTLIQESFVVISEDNKVDDYDIKSFGYFSHHFIVKMKNGYSGPRYDKIKNIPFEVQVRTIAMDAWANASHYLEYKSEIDVPKELKKDFYALSGLFYVADTHFEMFYKEKKTGQNKLNRESEKDILNQDINHDTLKAYLGKYFPKRKSGDAKNISSLLDELIKAGYRKIGDVAKAVDAAQDAFNKYETEVHGGEFYQVGVVRVSLEMVDFNYYRILRDRQGIKDTENKLRVEQQREYGKYLSLLKKNG